MKKTKFDDYAIYVKFAAMEYGCNVVFTENYQRSIEARGLAAGRLHTSSACHIHRGGDSWVFFKIGNTPVGVVAHESYHAIHHMFLDVIGAKHLDEEIVAYHLDYLVEEIMHFRNKLIDANIGVQSSTKKRQHGKRSVSGSGRQASTSSRARRPNN